MKSGGFKRPIFVSLMVLLSLIFLIWILELLNFGFSYQESESMVPGWYGTYPVLNLSKGDIVLFYPDPPIENLMISRHWILPNTPMMKYVRGVPGDWVCIKNKMLWINNIQIGPIADQDSLGRPLPSLSFCQKLLPSQFFMISTRSSRSFDSRYFGVVNKNQIISKAVKL